MKRAPSNRWCVVRDRQHRRGPAMDAGATQVGIFSEQVWGAPFIPDRGPK